MACSKVRRTSGLPTTTSVQSAGSLRCGALTDQGAHLVAALEQHRNETAADVAGAAGDEDAWHAGPEPADLRARCLHQDLSFSSVVEGRTQLGAVLGREQQAAMRVTSAKELAATSKATK